MKGGFSFPSFEIILNAEIRIRPEHQVFSPSPGYPLSGGCNLEPLRFPASHQLGRRTCILPQLQTQTRSDILRHTGVPTITVYVLLLRGEGRVGGYAG